MAYEKQTWHTGDVITESKLNHMEDGIAKALEVMFISFSDEDGEVLDHTWQEIHDAVVAKKLVVIYSVYGVTVYFGIVQGAGYDGQVYDVDVGKGSDSAYYANSPDEYPVFGSGPQ